MRVAYLEKRDAAKNMQRYYHVYVTPTLFGEYAMVREWGRLGRRGGNRMESWFASKDEAIRSGKTLAEAKRRRGYGSPATVKGYTPLPVRFTFCSLKNKLGIPFTHVAPRAVVGSVVAMI